MAKYIIEFSKKGTICYTSHLDLMRAFKRAFKRAGIPLAYSQGFNPHPKMGFAQPLSLGYWSLSEFIEFETAGGDLLPNELMVQLAQMLPEGIELLRCLPADHLTKTLAAHTCAAEYMIEIPLTAAEGDAEDAQVSSDAPVSSESPDASDTSSMQGGAPHADLLMQNQADPRDLWHAYMDQPQILAWKRQKKKKDLKQVDIRPMIREITFQKVGDTLFVDTVLDSGSSSNLSPELVIATLGDCFGMRWDRSQISVMRKALTFDRPLEQLLRG